MKLLRTVCGAVLLSLLGARTQAQMPVTSVASPAEPIQWKDSRDVAVGLGVVPVRLNEINSVLQQAGYGTLPNTFTTYNMSFQRQSNRRRRAWSLPYEFGVSINSPTTANGTNQVRANLFFYRINLQYVVLRTGRLGLAPQLGFGSTLLTMNVTKLNPTTPSLASVLANPGNTQSANLGTMDVGFNVGMAANYQIPVGKITTNCEYAQQNLVVLGLNAGYRLGNRVGMDPNHEVSAANPSVQFAGWYASLRIGFGTRYGRTTQP